MPLITVDQLQAVVVSYQALTHPARIIWPRDDALHQCRGQRSPGQGICRLRSTNDNQLVQLTVAIVKSR